jgi:hypothetical protein
VRRKSDPAKLAIAAWLRRETTLSLHTLHTLKKKIATRVYLGTSRSANTQLHDWMKQSNLLDPP